jgi:hypothetical protein
MEISVSAGIPKAAADTGPKWAPTHEDVEAVGDTEGGRLLGLVELLRPLLLGLVESSHCARRFIFVVVVVQNCFPLLAQKTTERRRAYGLPAEGVMFLCCFVCCCLPGSVRSGFPHIAAPGACNRALVLRAEGFYGQGASLKY